MENKIFVRIKSGEYVEALDPSRARRTVLHLTTIEDYQTAAEIPLYLVSGSERKPLATLTVERLSPLSSKECRLDLETRLLGRRRAEFRVIQNGRLVLSETLRVPIPGQGRRIPAAAAILAGTAALGLLAFLLIRGGGLGEPRARTPGARTTSAVAMTPPNPAPAAAAPSEAAPRAAPSAPETAEVPAAPPSPPAPAPVPPDPLTAAREAFRSLGEEVLTLYFSADSSEILPDQKAKLGKVGAVLARYPELELAISGHCATAGTEKGRMSLSRDRARAVYEALAATGWKPSKKPAVEGFGDQRPATRDEDRQALNRRVEIRLAP